VIDIIIQPCINYTLIITFINNIAIINKNYGRQPDLIFLFKIPIGTRKYFFAIYIVKALVKNVRQPCSWRMSADVQLT